MQLTTVGKEVFKGARQAQQLEAAGSEGPKVAQRLRKIKLVDDPHACAAPRRGASLRLGNKRGFTGESQMS